MDQDDDGLDAFLFDLWHQSVDRLCLVAKLESRNSRRGDDIRRVLQGEANEGDGDAVELLHDVSWKQGLACALVDGAGSEIAELRPLERSGSLTAVLWVTASVLHAQQFCLALIELVVADRGDLKPHE